MIPRTLEPTPDDPDAEAAQYHLMDHSQVNRLFVQELIAGGDLGRQVIDLGCGPAGISIELCRQAPAVRVMAIDADVAMLEIAKLEIELAGLLDRMSLVHANVLEMDGFEDAMTDTVISNSLIHHLPDPAAGLKTSLRLVRPGGRLFVRDLARPQSSEQVERLVETHAGQENQQAQQLFRQSLHAALTIEEIGDVARGLGISDQHVQMTSDRHWTIDAPVN